jgi:hypothetical protein
MAMLDNQNTGVGKPSEDPIGAHDRRVQIGLAFYNIGLNASQVQTEKLYNKWVLRNVRRDVNVMIEKYNMDVICLSEVGQMTHNLEHTLSQWMIRDREQVETGRYPLVERMLRELVDNSAEWKVFAMAHYGLLIRWKSVKLVEEPVLMRLYNAQPDRVAMKFKIAPTSSSVEKPTEPTEVWNIHCPSSEALLYKLGARRGVWNTITHSSASSTVVGGDMNMSRFQVESFNNKVPANSTRRWSVHEPQRGRPGDLTLTRNVFAEFVDMTIGIGYIWEKAFKSTDAHNACAIAITYAIQGETQVNTHATLVPWSDAGPCATSVAKPSVAMCSPLPMAAVLTTPTTSVPVDADSIDDSVIVDPSVAIPQQTEMATYLSTASLQQPLISGETDAVQPGLDESDQCETDVTQPAWVQSSTVGWEARAAGSSADDNDALTPLLTTWQHRGGVDKAQTGVAKPGLDKSPQIMPLSLMTVCRTGKDTDSWIEMTDTDSEEEEVQSNAEASVISRLSAAMDGPTGLPEQAEAIDSLLKFLWWGPEFHATDEDAWEWAEKRCFANFEWIEQIRQNYAPEYVRRPVPRHHQFKREEVAKMHNDYRESLEWMPVDLRIAYESLKLEAQHGAKGKGKHRTSANADKPAAKERTPSAKAHQMKHSTFNVCFFKAFGDKQLFWHFVKVGELSQNVDELLQSWALVKSSEKYQTLVQKSMKRSDEVTEMKRQVTVTRGQMFNAAKHSVSNEVYQQTVAAHEEAQRTWKAMNRSTQNTGMHDLLHEHE